MARLAEQDWGFTEITRKFERDRKSVRKAPARKRRGAAARARGTMHVGIWLSAVAICLLGLVAVHVGILKKNMEFNDLIREKNDLSTENARLSGEVATLSSPERIEQIATKSLGMVPPDRVQYVYIEPPGGQPSYASLDNPASGAVDDGGGGLSTTGGAGGGRTAAP